MCLSDKYAGISGSWSRWWRLEVGTDSFHFGSDDSQRVFSLSGWVTSPSEGYGGSNAVFDKRGVENKIASYVVWLWHSSRGDSNLLGLWRARSTSTVADVSDFRPVT